MPDASHLRNKHSILAILGVPMDSEDKIIVFRGYDTGVEANLAKTKLDAYGIPCFLTGENFINIYPLRNDIFPGVRLHIFENDKPRAIEILETIN